MCRAAARGSAIYGLRACGQVGSTSVLYEGIGFGVHVGLAQVWMIGS